MLPCTRAALALCAVCCLLVAGGPAPAAGARPALAAADGCRIAAGPTLDPLSAYFASLDRAEMLAYNAGDAGCLRALTTADEGTAVAGRLQAQKRENGGTTLQLRSVVETAMAPDTPPPCQQVTARILLQVAYVPKGASSAPARDRYLVTRDYQIQDQAPAGSTLPAYVATGDRVVSPPPLAAGTGGPFAAALATAADRPVIDGQTSVSWRPALTAAIARNGFVIDSQFRSLNFYLYEGMYTNEVNLADSLPTFVTIDAGWHAFHVLFDRTLLAAESVSLRPRLVALLEGLLRANAAQRTALTSPEALAANGQNAIYLAVPLRVLGGSPPAGSLSPDSSATVAQEVANVQAHAGPAYSSFAGASVDYRLFTPRGHYSEGPELASYFMAMNWLALVQAPLEAKGAIPISQAQAGARRTVLLAALLQPGAPGALLRSWHSLADPITTLIGQPSGPALPEVLSLFARVYGPHLATSGALQSASLLAAFMARVFLLPAPAYRNNVGTAVRAFGLFPARAIPDGSLAAALTWPNVGTPAMPRALPSGLDVLAALGSTRAAQLAAQAGPSANYAGALARAVPPFLQALKAPSLYAHWLGALRPLALPMPAAAPPVMHTPAWGDKELLTGLASWSELRHDSLLYASQPGGYGGGGGCSFRIYRPGYVEPIPLAWADLADLADRLAAVTRGAALLGGLPAKQRGDLLAAEDRYRLGLRALATIAGAELQGTPLSTAQQLLLADPSPILGTPMNVFFTETPHPRRGEQEQQAAEIADVATDLSSGRVLEVGEGLVRPIWVLVPIDGWMWLARGQVSTYYEFATSGQRLSDQQWQQQLESLSGAPKQPDWIEALSR